MQNFYLTPSFSPAFKLRATGAGPFSPAGNVLKNLGLSSTGSFGSWLNSILGINPPAQLAPDVLSALVLAGLVTPTSGVGYYNWNGQDLPLSGTYIGANNQSIAFIFDPYAATAPSSVSSSPTSPSSPAASTQGGQYNIPLIAGGALALGIGAYLFLTPAKRH